MNADAWQWDISLYEGSAPHYAVGRMPYPEGLVAALRDELGLDGTGRLLDIGCGPGSLTLRLAPLFAQATGIDADPGMIEVAGRLADAAGLGNVNWRRMRAEDLPADLGEFDVVTFAQSFHWMDQPLVARNVHKMLAPNGAWAHVHATTHRGSWTGDPLGPPEPSDVGPQPPWAAIGDLVKSFLGPVRRAGTSTLPNGTRAGEEDVMRLAGFRGPSRLTIDVDQVAERREDEIVSAVYSLSGAAPHLFGDRLGAFDTELRKLLRATAPAGVYREPRGEIEIVIWRP